MHSIRLLLGLHVHYQFARDAFLGIAEEARTYGNIVTQLKLPHESFELAAKALPADAVIAAPNSLEELQEVLSLRELPTVCIANFVEKHDVLPVVGNDDEAVGRLAADYFRGAGFRHFGFFANTGEGYFHPRQRAFNAALLEAGHTCHVGPVPSSRDERISLDQLADWLTPLPKPLAVFCPYDGHARDVINACNLAQLPVPDAVSVVGVDNDALICLSTSPPLASIATSAAEVGRRAIDLVLAMLRGEEPPPKPILIPPSGLVIRESCGELAINDEDVAAAVSFIRRNLRERLTVARIANALALSERTLQRKFHEVLHQSPNEVIRRARIAHAKRLLTDTDLPLPEVARRSGMIRVQRLANLLKAESGVTPIQFRRRHGDPRLHQNISSRS